MDNLAFVAAGYLITALALGGYVLHLRRRAASAVRRAAALAAAAKRDRR